MTQGGILVVFAGIAQSQDDVEAVVRMVEGSAVNHLEMVRLDKHHPKIYLLVS